MRHNNNNNKTMVNKADKVVDAISTASFPSVMEHHHSSSTEDDVSADDVYDFYRENVIPAITSSLPILLGRMASDTKDLLKLGGSQFLHFLLPKHWAESVEESEWTMPHQILWDQAMAAQRMAGSGNNTVEEFLLRHFDTNQDGHISPAELINMTEFMERWHSSVTTPSSWYAWVIKEWPVMDWKIGVFLWRTFGGILVLLCILSIIPGRLHGISARILRWPVLGLTYFLIGVELCVYTIIRLGIRLAEAIVAHPKHRALRRRMAKARSYEEWYELASQLDKSQKRDKWQSISQVDAQTSKRYNWSFITELMKDMKIARDSGDSLLALAVLQQCTRKNVGGIMSEDLFSYTNTGEPMHIVRDFIEEVAKTMEWLTDEALKLPLESDDSIMEDSETKREYEQSLDKKVRIEKDKIWKSLVNFASSVTGDDSKASSRPSNDSSVSSLETMSQTTEGQQSSSRATINRAMSHPSRKSAATQLPSFHRKQVSDIFKRARAAYGRTALCLSGGATMGAYHFGHIRGLLEAGVLPNIVSGTSAGAVVAAVVCTRTDEELMHDLRPEVMVKRLVCFSRPWSERLKSLAQHGHMFDMKEWLDLIKWFCMGDMTFEEAYQKTGRLFCITVSATTKKAAPVVLNHLSAPNVTLASAIVASAAVPGFIPPVKLRYKMPSGQICESSRDQTYFDGSIDNDIPVSGLAEMLNCQFFIAAQCNPHIVPFFFNPKGGVGRPSRWSSGVHEHSWRGGFLLATLEMYLKNDMKAKFRFLHDMEASVSFTSQLFTQDFVGSTTLVPQVSIIDFFKLLSDLQLSDMDRTFQGGSISAYEHVAMIKTHYRIADTLDYCLEALRTGKRERQRDRPQLRIEIYKRLSEEELERDGRQKCSEDETLSTHASLNDDDDIDDEEDDATSHPSKWEEIQPTD